MKGLLLVNKPIDYTSFKLVSILRRITGVKKIGHAGTLDPFASGVMVMLIGREFTKLSNQFLSQEKEYIAEIRLGITTDTMDHTGSVTNTSDLQPSLEEVEQEIAKFQGTIQQTPPMYSAKKVQGKKLYELARKGKEIERSPVEISLTTTLLKYEYPHIHVHIHCSKGTYIRCVANDLGSALGCGAHLTALTRKKSGSFHLSECVNLETITNADQLKPHLLSIDDCIQRSCLHCQNEKPHSSDNR